MYEGLDPLADVPRIAFYRVQLATPERSTRGGDTSADFVRSLTITPDSSAMIYLASNRFSVTPDFVYDELYRVQFGMPSIRTKLNGPLVTDGGVHSFQVR